MDAHAISGEAFIDLQLHTLYSDGVWTPSALVDYLVQAEFTLAAVTDHDTMKSIAAMQRAALQTPLTLLPAVEMSTSWRGRATNVLCFGVNPHDVALAVLCQRVVQGQRENTQQVYQYLLEQGYRFPRRQEILAASGGVPLTPNDNACLLYQHGYTLDIPSTKYILERSGFRWITNDINIVVEAAHRCGAICILAHPGRNDGHIMSYSGLLLDQLYDEVPLDGIEVYYPAHSLEQVAYYLEYARKNRLLISAGSGSHSFKRPPVKYKANLCRSLLKRLGFSVR